MEDIWKKVLVISKSIEDPSAYYRLLQYINGRSNVHCAQLFSRKQYRSYYDGKESLAAKAVFGIQTWIKIVLILLWDVLYFHAELIIINRKIVPRYCPKLAAEILKKYMSDKFIVWDFDDNIFENGEISSAEAAIYREKADRVVVTNDYLKNLLCPDLQKKTMLLPTTDRVFENIVLSDWNSIRKKLFPVHINLLWTGTKGNICYLDDIVSQLDRAAKDLGSRTITLYIVSNMHYERQTENLRIKNVRWSRERLLRLMPRMHIGLMPLRENAFTKGKGAFKAVQYIGAGLPVIASPVGFNCSVVRDGENGLLTEREWGECMKRLVRSYHEWEKYSLNARSSWEEDFHSKRNLEFWERMIHA